MFFLLRMTFWLGLVLVLLPREKTPESDKLPQIGASEAVQAATAAVSDMGQFCKRQPAACEVGGQAATVIGQRSRTARASCIRSSPTSPTRKRLTIPARSVPRARPKHRWRTPRRATR